MFGTKVTVLMPVYNGEKYLKEAIDSILSQSFKDFELLIINDGSSDNTENLLKSYNDFRIRIIDNKTNKGLIYSLNLGIKESKGEFIARMDADDISYPDRLKIQYEFMKDNPDVCVCGTGFQSFGESNFIHSQNKQITIFNLIKNNPVAHPTVFIRKSILFKYNLEYSYDFFACEDYELWSRIILVSKIVNIPNILLKYRTHNTNVSKVFSIQQNENANRVKESLLKKIFDKDDRKVIDFVFYLRKMSVNIQFFMFNFIKLKNSKSSIKICLFGIIPFIKIKKRKVYLFNFIYIGKTSKDVNYN